MKLLPPQSFFDISYDDAYSEAASAKLALNFDGAIRDRFLAKISFHGVIQDEELDRISDDVEDLIKRTINPQVKSAIANRNPDFIAEEGRGRATRCVDLISPRGEDALWAITKALVEEVYPAEPGEKAADFHRKRTTSCMIILRSAHKAFQSGIAKAAGLKT